MTDNNPFLVVTIGDFNAWSSRWCINGKSNYEGTKIDCLATEHDLKQVINEPTHLLENSSSCIDLKFTSQPNLVKDAGIHSSFHPSIQVSHRPDINFNDNLIKKVLTKNFWVCILIVNLILMKIVKEYLRKLINLLVLFASSEIFYRDHPFCKSINLLLDLT